MTDLINKTDKQAPTGDAVVAKAPQTKELMSKNQARYAVLKEFWYYFSQNKIAVVGLFIVVFVIFMAIFAPWITPYSPSEQFRDALLVPPFWQDGGSTRFIFGTDDIGRDIYTRIVYGARVSISVGSMVVVVALFVGICLGLIAGYFRGLIETVIMRLMDIMMTLPSLLLAIVIVAILGPSLVNAALAVIIVQLPAFVRLTRAAAIQEANRDYVIASKLNGAGSIRIMFSAILPNCMAPLIVQATLGFSSAVLDLAALGFLGLGAQPPTPEWGTMLSSALQFIQRAWWVVTFPGLAILIVVLAFNLMGDGLRDALDPKLKR